MKSPHCMNKSSRFMSSSSGFFSKQSFLSKLMKKSKKHSNRFVTKSFKMCSCQIPTFLDLVISMEKFRTKLTKIWLWDCSLNRLKPFSRTLQWTKSSASNPNTHLHPCLKSLKTKPLKSTLKESIELLEETYFRKTQELIETEAKP